MLMGRTGSYWDIIDNYDSPYLYILDDFNANVLWINSAYADELKHLCIINSLILADCVNLPVSTNRLRKCNTILKFTRTLLLIFISKCLLQPIRL